MIKYNIKYEALGEIRMGSPYNGANVILDGEFIPDMSELTFQDKGIVSNDGFTCYLIQWDMIDNNPGYKIWKIDAKDRKISKSKHIDGCCDDINLNDSGVTVKTWKWDSSKKCENVSETEISFS